MTEKAKSRRQKAKGRRPEAKGRTGGDTIGKLVLSLLCILHGALGIPAVLEAEIIDRVMAVVSGAVIMQSDVLAAFELGMVAPGTTDDPMAAVLTQLIDRQLMLAEVDRYVPPEPSADAIDRAAQQVRARFATASDYDSALARSGMGVERLHRLLRDDLAAFTRNGQVVPFDAARAEITATVAATRRAELISDWVRSLRRRADISNLYLVRR